MQLTVAAWDDRVFAVELDGAEPLATLHAILEAESGLPAAQQQLLHNSQPLPAAAQGQGLAALGIADGDVLMLVPRNAGGGAGQQGAGQQGAGQQQQQQQQQRGHQRPPEMALAPDGSAAAPAAFIQALKAQPAVLADLAVHHPALAEAVREENVAALQTELRKVAVAQRERQAELAQQAALLEADPFDPEAQAKIEELIRQQNIDANMAAAMEHTPEVFGSVEMLYVDMEVNGVPVKAFVDSGAQMTIMTQDFANKCYLGRLLDKRWSGVAVGVGSSRILGRIHQTPLKVGGHFTTASITVLEQRDGPQFIFGLDMLKRHQCCIDLAAGVLRFGSCDASLQFLPDHLIPKDFKRHIDEVSAQDAERNVQDARKESAGGAGPSSAPPAVAAGSSRPAGDGAAASSAAAGDAAGAAAKLPGARDTPAPMDTASPGPAPASAPQPPAGGGAGGPAAAAGAGVDEAAVAQLVGLGFARDAAVAALRAAGGNVDTAASFLFGM